MIMESSKFEGWWVGGGERRSALEQRSRNVFYT
jgi:hypothetical protein